MERGSDLWKTKPYGIYGDGDLTAPADQVQQRCQFLYENKIFNHHKIAIGIVNNTDQDIKLVTDAFLVGRWEIPPAQVIPSGQAGIMGVCNRDNEPRGVQGIVLYEGEDFVACMAFSNPYVGSCKTYAEVRDRGCWTYSNGETQLVPNTLDLLMEGLTSKGGRTQHTVRSGKAEYSVSFEGSRVQVFTLTKKLLGTSVGAGKGT
eukprot:RCo038923